MNKQYHQSTISDFENYLKEIKLLANASIEQRIRHVNDFFNFVRGKHLSKITLQDVYSYVIHLKWKIGENGKNV